MVWVWDQLGAQETSATALSDLPVVGGRWAALASELTAGQVAGAERRLAPGGAFGTRSGASWNRRRAAGRLKISYKALLHKVRLLGL